MSSAGDERYDLAAYTPVFITGDCRQVVWLPMQHQPLREAFFEESVDAFRRREPAHRALLTPLIHLHRAAARLGVWQDPAGFIFHLSRCGSTALARAVNADPEVILVAEAQPVNASLGGTCRPDQDDSLDLFRSLLALLARPRTGEERRLVVKFSSWAVTLVDLIHAHFPSVPKVLAFRDPVEVLVSLLDRPPPWLLGSAAAGDRGAPGEPAADMLAGAVNALEARYRSALGNAACFQLQVDYRRLGERVPAVLDLFGLPTDEPALARADEGLRTHAKAGAVDRPYTDDTHAKRARASEPLRAAAATALSPLYEQLSAAAAVEARSVKPR